MPRHRVTRTDLLVAILAIMAGFAVAAGLTGPIRVLIGAAAYAVLPGWGLVRWLRSRVDTMTVITLTVAVSSAVSAIAGTLMLALDRWNPDIYSMIVCGLSVLLALLPGSVSTEARTNLTSRFQFPGLDGVQEQPRRTFSRWLIALLVVASILWFISLKFIAADSLGVFGLLPVYSPLWYLALALAVTVWVASIVRGFSRIAVAALAVFTLLLYATTAFTQAAPRLPYIYKHMAVTRLFEVTGNLWPNIDIYNRWPGFFAASGVFGGWVGLAHPIAYSGFIELLSAILNAVLVFLLARSFAIRTRDCVVAASVFTTANWVGQGYYSPQSFCYPLYLLLALLILRYFRGVPIPLMGRIEQLIARIFDRRKQPTAPGSAHGTSMHGASTHGTSTQLGGPQRAIIASLIVLLQAAIVISHQLTPYMAVIGFLPLALVGYVRPKILGFVLLAMNLLFLWPNFAYVQKNYGLLSGFNFFENATTNLQGFGVATIGNQIQSFVVIGLTGLIILLAGFGLFLRARTGDLKSVLIVGWLSIAPVAILLGQNYGGEGRLRVVLFGLPWWCIGIAWLVQGVRFNSVRARSALAVAAVLITSMFTFAWLQPEADSAISKSDIDAAEWMNANANKQDQIVGALPSHPLFPLTVDYRYPVILQNQDNAYDVTQAIQSASLRVKVKGVVAAVASLTANEKLYIVFSEAQLRAAARHRVPGFANLREFESRIDGLPSSTTIFDNGEDRIYMLTGSR